MNHPFSCPVDGESNTSPIMKLSSLSGSPYGTIVHLMRALAGLCHLGSCSVITTDLIGLPYPPAAGDSTKPRIAQGTGRRPISFEVNQGQAYGAVKCLFRGRESTAM